MNISLEWHLSEGLVPYPAAVQAMEARVEAIRAGQAQELVWLLEHPALYTAGTSARAEDLLNPAGLPVYNTGRGGQYTYHGPGQRVAYVLLDLKRRSPGVPDIRAYVHNLEEWLIQALETLGVRGERRTGRVGIWVGVPGGEAKIAAIGVRIRRGVTYHGVALNVSPDLAAFSGIVPCGVRGYGVTSLQQLGLNVSMAAADRVLRDTWNQVFA